jgi:hypothetical protein
MTIAQLIHRERASLRRLHLAGGIAVALAATAAIVALAMVILGSARWMSLPRVTPFVAWTLVVAANVGAWMLARRAVEREASLGEVAAAVEREQSLRSGSVRGTMEVAQSGSLGRRAADQLSARLAEGGTTLVPGTRRRVRQRVGRVALVAAIALVALGALAPAFGDGLSAVMRPVDAWRGTLLPAIAFENLPSAVVRGEALRLRILAPGRREITIQRRATGEGWHTDHVPIDAAGRAALDLGPMTADVHLAATDGRSATDTVVVKVADRPFLGGIAMRAIYPDYLGRESEGLAIGEPARVPAGTLIDISGRASTELNEVKLVNESNTNGADVRTLTVSGHTFRGRFVTSGSGAWRWVASGVAGPVTDVPPPLAIEVVPDSTPRVEIVSPANDTLVAPDAKVTLRLAAMDDHGLSSIDIVSWKVTDGKAAERATVKVAEHPGPIWGTSLVLDVVGRGLAAGDVLHLMVAATDNSPWRQRGESRELIVRVATSEEQRDMARATGDSAVAAADAAVKAQKALERRAAAAAQDRAAASPDGKGDEKMSFEAAQKAKALAQDQKAMTDQVKQLSEVAKALEQQLREAGALDSGLARQLQEAQAMLREALTPELLDQMKKLEQGAQELSKGDVQQSLAALKEQQRRLREQLEKSAEMLRRAAMEGSMQTLSDEARELAKKQRQLADSAGARPGALKDQRASELADRTGRLEKEMEKLQDRLENAKATTGAEKTLEARQNAQGAEEKLRAGPDKSGEAAEKMDKAADAMKQARDGQIKEWKQELTSALDQSIQELLQMSREESSLQQQVKSGAAKSEDARGEQSAIKQGLDAASQRLQKEAQKSSLLSGRSQRAVTEAQQKVDQATQQASDPRTSQQSGQAMNEAAEALNKAAASLARDRERANTATSASGFAEMIQQMQEMAGKQGNINSQAQSLMPQPGSAMSQMAQAQSRALARQQRQIADKLDELSDAAAGDKAAKMAQEARQLADALEGSRIDASTLARQQQLFKKMLDAGRSLEKEDREESEKREAKAAVDPRQFTPQAAPGKAKGATRFREPTWDELRGLTADERRIILEYFKKLNGEQPPLDAGPSVKPPPPGNGRGG